MGFIGRMEVTIPDILRTVNLNKKSGKLTLTRVGNTVDILFKHGTVISAASNSTRNFLGQILISQKRLTENDLTAALDVQHFSADKKKLGAILVEKGLITHEELQETIRQQVEDVISQCLTWENGFFRFDIMDPETDDEIDDEIVVDATECPAKTGIDPEHLLLEGTRRLDERQRTEGSIPCTPAGTVRPTPHVPAADHPDDRQQPVKPPWLIREAPPAFTHELAAAETRKPLTAKESVPAGSPSLQANAHASPQENRSPVADEITLSSSISPWVLIMKLAPDVVSRGVLLSVWTGGFTGFDQFGMDGGKDFGDKQVCNITIPRSESSIFAATASRRTTYRGEIGPGKMNDYFLNQLGGKRPQEAVLIPIIMAGKVVAIFYGDDAGTGQPIGDLEQLEAIIGQTFSTIERSLLRHRSKTRA